MLIVARPAVFGSNFQQPPHADFIQSTDRRPAARWREAAASSPAPTCGLSCPTTTPATAAARQRLDDGKARDKQQAAASGEPESSGVSGAAAKQERKDKRTRKERNKKQKKPAAVANGEASTAVSAGEHQNQTMMSTNREADDEDGGYSSGQPTAAAAGWQLLPGAAPRAVPCGRLCQCRSACWHRRPSNLTAGAVTASRLSIYIYLLNATALFQSDRRIIVLYISSQFLIAAAVCTHTPYLT
jgi:hypothetical protein